jgi:hypothetical protein
MSGINLQVVRGMDVLYFDLECRPGHWIGGDYVSKIITAAAWSWNDEDEVQVRTHFEMSTAGIASTLAQEIADCDLVVGHYIRGFDLPLLNGELLRSGHDPLEPVMSHDTKLDMMPAHGRSKSQENLAAQLGLDEQKVKVTLPEWEAFNSKDVSGYDRVFDRVKDDVIQNRALRKALLSIGWIGPPQMWRPKAQRGYRP